MEVTETEIMLPLTMNRKISFSWRDILSLWIVCLLMLGGGIFLLMPQDGKGPTIGEILLSIILIVLSILVLIAQVLVWQRVGSRSPHAIRINHEGIFFSHFFPTAVMWCDIATLVPYTWTSLGLHPIALGIIPKDPEAIIARIIAHKSRNVLSRFTSKVNMYLYRRSKARTPLNIPQGILPISIDELIVLIQERFANELHEHGITILAWQH